MPPSTDATDRLRLVLVGGGPAAGVDFIDRAYGAFPYLVGFVLLTSLVLIFRPPLVTF